MDTSVSVPEDVLIRALAKARLLYEEATSAAGQDPGPEDECWAEFENLAEFLDRPAPRPEDDITFDPTMPWTD